MSDNYSVTPNSVNNFLDGLTRAASNAGDHVAALQKIVNGYSASSAAVSNHSMSDAALRNKLDNLQLQIDDIYGTIREVQAFCNMVRDILTKEHLLSSDWQKTTQPAIDEFKNLKGIL